MMHKSSVQQKPRVIDHSRWTLTHIKGRKPGMIERKQEKKHLNDKKNGKHIEGYLHIDNEITMKGNVAVEVGGEDLPSLIVLLSGERKSQMG